MRREEVLLFLAGSQLSCYVYILKRPNGEPFYVGKGSGPRVFCHEADALGAQKSYKLNIIRAIQRSGQGVDYEIDGFFSTDSEAHAREIALIRSIGRHDLKTGPLANLTDGGEGTCGISDETKQRHLQTLCGEDAEGERGIANRFFAKLCSVESVPVKPLTKFKPVLLSPHPDPRRFSERAASALAASAIANRIQLEPGCVIPRLMTIDGASFVIENGVGRDILKSRLATLSYQRSPVDAAFKVDATGLAFIIRSIGRDILLDAGVLMPALD